MRRHGDSGPLSQFELSYSGLLFFDEDLDPSLPFNIFGPVPSGTFSHFGGHHYLSINLHSRSHSFQIYSALSVPRHDCNLSSYSLILSGIRPSSSSIHAPILELIRAMPKITHLELHFEAWEILASWKVDVRDAFPCLNTVELSRPQNSGNLTWILNSLPESLQLKTLILTEVILYPKTLVDAVLRTGAKTLELRIDGSSDDVEQERIVAILRRKGIKVNVKSIQ